MPEAQSSEKWYAVRCLFSHPKRVRPPRKCLYEERITIWKTDSWDEAFSMAESEAVFYAQDGGDVGDCVFIESIDAFHLFDHTPGAGTEVWSKMRDSDLKAKDYVKKYCKTATDRMGNHRKPPDPLEPNRIRAFRSEGD